ncbi:MAG: response regulator [Rhodospirillaceae bacterium]
MKRILVIDDDENVRESFLAALENCGYAVELAASGVSGLESATAARPDLIFLDLKMPEMTGAETLEHLQDVCPGVPVFIVTAFYAEFLKPLRSLQSKGIAFEVARKPLTVSEIRAIADGALSNMQNADDEGSAS